MLTLNSFGSPKVQDGVIIQHTGSAYMFVFPGALGRIKGVNDPAGKITVGPNITVAYALRLIRGGRARFICLDSRTAQDLSPVLRIEQVDKLFGFEVRDARQGSLDITIKPSFMAEIREHKLGAIGEKMARQGNLDVIFKSDNGSLKIMKVVLD